MKGEKRNPKGTPYPKRKGKYVKYTKRSSLINKKSKRVVKRRLVSMNTASSSGSSISPLINNGYLLANYLFINNIDANYTNLVLGDEAAKVAVKLKYGNEYKDIATQENSIIYLRFFKDPARRRNVPPYGASIYINLPDTFIDTGRMWTKKETSDGKYELLGIKSNVIDFIGKMDCYLPCTAFLWDDTTPIFFVHENCILLHRKFGHLYIERFEPNFQPGYDDPFKDLVSKIRMSLEKLKPMTYNGIDVPCNTPQGMTFEPGPLHGDTINQTYGTQRFINYQNEELQGYCYIWTMWMMARIFKTLLDTVTPPVPLMSSILQYDYSLAGLVWNNAPTDPDRELQVLINFIRKFSSKIVGEKILKQSCQSESERERLFKRGYMMLGYVHLSIPYDDILQRIIPSSDTLSSIVIEPATTTTVTNVYIPDDVIDKIISMTNTEIPAGLLRLKDTTSTGGVDHINAYILAKGVDGVAIYRFEPQYDPSSTSITSLDPGALINRALRDTLQNQLQAKNFISPVYYFPSTDITKTCPQFKELGGSRNVGEHISYCQTWSMLFLEKIHQIMKDDRYKPYWKTLQQLFSLVLEVMYLEGGTDPRGYIRDVANRYMRYVFDNICKEGVVYAEPMVVE